MGKIKLIDRLNNIADSLEPTSHCCECTPGPNYCCHIVHIQYPDCKCEKKNYRLMKNGE